MTESATDWIEVYALSVVNGVGDPDYLVMRGIHDGVDPAWIKQAFVEDPIRPGFLDRRVFDQDVVWHDIHRRPHRIADRDDLTDEYLVNLVTYVRFWAGNWVPWGAGEPLTWIESTPLMCGLRAEAARRGVEVEQVDEYAPSATS